MQRISDAVHEKWLGVDTAAGVSLNELGIDNPLFRKYSATEYSGFKRAMKHLDIQKDKDVFLDLGSGKGRVLIMAAKYPFAKVIGVEISKDLNSIAERNIAKVCKRLKCKI